MKLSKAPRLIILLMTFVVIISFASQSVIAQAEGIIATAWSPNGQMIVVSGTGGFLSIWDANTGNLIRNFTGLSGTIYTVAWSPDSTKIASAGDDKLIHIWNVSNGQSLARLIGHDDDILCIDWSPDGSKIASVSGNEQLSLRIWDTTTFQQLNAFQAGNLQAVKWNTNGSKIAVVNTNVGIIIVDPLANIPIQNWVNYLVGPNSSASGSAGSMAWRNDNTTIAVGYFDGKIYLWNVATNQQLSVLQGHTGWVGSLSWSPDGTRLASASSDGTIKIWNVAVGNVLTTIQKGSGLTLSTAWSPSSNKIAYGNNSGMLQIDVAPTIPATATRTSTAGLTQNSPTLKSVFNPTTCQRACWMGIEPGVTTPSQLQTILTSNGISDQIQDDGPGSIPANNPYFWTPSNNLPFIDNRDGQAGVIASISQGKVQGILIPVDIAISSITNEYGSPIQVRQLDPDTIEMVYPSLGMNFFADKQIATDRVTLLTLYSPLGYPQYVEPTNSPLLLQDCAVFVSPCTIATATPTPTATNTP